MARRTKGGMVYVSGQIGVDPTTGALATGGIGPQVEQAIRNVTAILATEGGALGDVVKVSVFLADMSEFASMNDVYSKMFSAPYPARTTIGAGLGAGARVEIDAVAEVPPEKVI